MDLQGIVNCCSVPSSILSVEKTPDGFCGAIHIVCANDQYREAMGSGYYDGMPYEELVPKDLKFEEFCFRAAHKNQRMHAYVETKALGCWTDQVMIPLHPQGPEIGYCQFLFEFTETAEPERMASVSMDTAAAVIKASITLLAGDDFKTSVREVLTDILEMSGANACRIMLIDHARREAINFCEKLRHGFVPVERGDGTIPYEMVASWEGMIAESNGVVVKDERGMQSLEERNPLWVRSLRQYEVKSLVLIPLRREKEVIGYLFVVNFDVEKAVEVKELIELMSVFLGAEIANHLLMKQLKELSMHDALTGLQNRRAMLAKMKLITEADDRKQFGIVSIDLNGLKMANDSSGHDAGDQLLIKVARALGGVFRASDLYRAGGDEFAVIASGISREAFDARVVQLRELVSDNHDISVSIGACWSDGSVSAQSVYQEADQRMYAEKREFYDSHPGLLR